MVTPAPLVGIDLPDVRYATAMRQSFIILGGALAIGLVSGIALRDQSAVVEADAAAQSWTPRNTITRESLMSADELDGQQPSASNFKSDRRPVQQFAGSGSSWSYRNCAAARAAGAAPIYRGQPGYGAHMDGDGDGIACEPYHGR